MHHLISNKISSFLLLFYFLHIGFSAAQSYYTPINRDYLLPIENAINTSSSIFHSNCKPYLASEVLEIQDSFYVPKNENQKHLFLSGSQNTNGKSVDIALSPLITALPGYEFSASKSILDTRLGGKLNVNFRKKLALEVQLLNFNSTFTDYWNNYSQKNKVIPGNGYGYYSALGFTNLQWNGFVSFSPNSYFNFAAGRGKNFFGDGYRSLLLSDVASNYDYLKITTTIWKLKYINLFTNFKDVRNTNGKVSRYQNKYGTFHYLSWNATKRINISFFESIIWQSRDTNNQNLCYDVNYLNPVIFYRSTEYALGSSDNAFIGASFKIKLFKKQQLYGQVLIDEFLLKQVKARNGWWANKQGFQLGLKAFDLFKLKGLFFQAEWNYVRPFTYAHSNTNQNYAHFNESLAHPLGANFSEYLADLNYQKRLWLIDLKVTYAQVGLDSAGKNYGQNIYQSNITHALEYGNKTGQGLKTDIATVQLTFGFLLNKANNIRLELGLCERYQKNNSGTLNSNYIFIGVRTALSNVYSDF